MQDLLNENIVNNIRNMKDLKLLDLNYNFVFADNDKPINIE